MKAIFLLPVIDEKITDECIKTISPKHLENLAIVDNSTEQFAKKYDSGYLHSPGGNIGVPKAWNWGISLLDDYDYLVIMSASMRFGSGMDDFREALNTKSNFYGLETQHGWHYIALSKKTFQLVGNFDENFFPAYYEDSDFIRRMEIRGIHYPMSKTARLPRVEIDATCVSVAHALKSGKVSLNMSACEDYFISKWGAKPLYDSWESRDKMYKYPFNDPTKGLSYWPHRSIAELKELYNLE